MPATFSGFDFGPFPTELHPDNTKPVEAFTFIPSLTTAETITEIETVVPTVSSSQITVNSVVISSDTKAIEFYLRAEEEYTGYGSILFYYTTTVGPKGPTQKRVMLVRRLG